METQNDARLRATGRHARPIGVLLTVALLGATLFAVSEWINHQSAYLIAEWGPLETLHAILTATAALLFFVTYRRSSGPVKVAAAALAMLAAAAFVRELDMKYLGRLDTAPDWFRLLSEHGLQDALVIGMTLPIFVYLYLQRRHFLGLVRLALRPQAWPLYAAGLLIFLSVYLDELPTISPTTLFWEEMSETYAYAFLLLAAWRHKQLSNDEGLNPHDPGET